MIKVELLSVIRRWHHRDGRSIRDIARSIGLSRITVKKHLANNEVEPQYSRSKVPSNLDDYAQTLTSWLHRKANCSRKQRCSVKQLFYNLIPLGYAGSYDRVAAFARKWREQEQAHTLRSSKGTYVPLQFAPSEAFQFDWSEDWVRIKGKKTKLQIAHFKLSHN